MTDRFDMAGLQSVRRWFFAGLVFLLAAFGFAAVAAGEGTIASDVAIARFIQQSGSPEIDAAARVASTVGDGFPAMVILAIGGVAILVVRQRPDLAFFLAAAAALRAIGPWLKILINSPRPSAEAVLVVGEAEGLGFPSGHALGAALFYGAVAVIATQIAISPAIGRGIQFAAVTMMILIAVSRVRLGVHWPTDVVGGLAFGLALVCFLWAAMLAVRQRPIRR